MNGSTLFASLVVGSVGFGFFLYGKRQRRVPHAIVGITMMVFPYFTGSVALTLGIGAGLAGLLALATYVGL